MTNLNPAPTLAETIANVDTTILQHLPLATQTIVAVENATKGAVPGTTKLTMTLDIIQALAQSASAGAQGNANVQAIAGLASLVTAIVQSFNSSGFFSHSSAPAPAAPVVANAHPSVLMKIFHPNLSHQQEAAAAAETPVIVPPPLPK
jgi:hypothetical protein